MSVLAPCPFCGSSAERTGGYAGGITIRTARCSNGDCLASFKSVDVAIWNRRAPLPAEQPSNPVPLDEHTRFILGRPNFTCIRAANRMRELGHEIERKAEAEQAAVIHLMLTMYFKHGADWMEHCNTYLARIVGQQTNSEGK